MKMGIDARFFGPKTGGGGIGRYVAELTKHLQELPFQDNVELFLKQANFHECKTTSPKFHKTMADIHWYGLKEQLAMPGIIAQSGVKLMHYPHWNIPRFSRVPFVVTIHDLILLDQKDSARTTTRGPLVHGVKYAMFRLVLEHAVYKSKAIMTVSEHAKERILHYFNVPKDKITVIPNGLSEPVVAKKVRLSDHGIYAPYFLYAGNAYPHKNLELILKAFALIQNQHPHVQVVIAGKRDVFSAQLESKARELMIPSDRLRFVDHPDDDLLARLYEDADAFIFPSLLEGFGIPPLEALQRKTPVIAANVRPMTDILQDAAHYVDPQDPKDLASAMLAHLSDPSLLARRLPFADELFERYTWHNAAVATKEVYDRVLKTL